MCIWWLLLNCPNDSRRYRFFSSRRIRTESLAKGAWEFAEQAFIDAELIFSRAPSISKANFNPLAPVEEKIDWRGVWGGLLYTFLPLLPRLEGTSTRSSSTSLAFNLKMLKPFKTEKTRFSWWFWRFWDVSSRFIERFGFHIFNIWLFVFLKNCMQSTYQPFSQNALEHNTFAEPSPHYNCIIGPRRSHGRDNFLQDPQSFSPRILWTGSRQLLTSYIFLLEYGLTR